LEIPFFQVGQKGMNRFVHFFAAVILAGAPVI
jgi:hypothetical protein